MTVRKLFAMVVIVASALGLVGPAAGSTAARTGDPLTPELRAWVDDHGPLRIGYYATGAPVGIVEDGEVTGGWAFELHRLMGIKTGVPIESVAYGTIDEVVAALRAGDIDLVGAAGARPDLREFAVANTEPMSWTPLVLAGSTGQQALGLDQLSGRSFTTIKGSPLVARVSDAFPDLTYIEADTIPAGLEAVASGEIDLYAGPLAIIGHQLTRLGLTLGPVGEALDVVEVFAWGQEGSPAVDVVNIARPLLSDAELSVVYVRWTGFDLSNPEQPPATWILTTIAVTLAGLVVLGIFALVLRRRVATATAELQTLNAELEQRVEERTQEVELANDRLRGSNQALSGFARTAAHDLRGPVTAIAGLSQLMQTIELPKDKVDATLATISASATRLNDMIHTMLEDAVRAGASEPSLDGPDFESWLAGVLAPEVAAIDATLVISAPTGRIPVNADLLRRVAVNLAGNALKYAVNDAAGCRVEVALVESEPGQWRLTVEDNGPGIPARLWGKVFESGYQAAGGDGRQHGFGMGLADVRHRVQQAGGSVAVADSALGGARLVVTLPTVPSDAASPTAAVDVVADVN